MVAAANKLAGCNRFTTTSFWKSITREVWATAPVSEEFDLLLEWSKDQVGQEHIFFLTSPTLDADSVAGKLEWIQRCAPKWMHRQYMIGPPKHLLARSNALLFDDSDKNVKAFKEHDGESVLIPRPWNSMHGKNVIEYLEEVLPWF
jgi:DNA relaxase NicK